MSELIVSPGAIKTLSDNLLKISTVESISVSSLSNFQTQLSALLANMENGEMRSIRYHPSSAFAPFSDADYYGYIYRKDATQCAVVLTYCSDTIYGGCDSNSNWHWESLNNRFGSITYNSYAEAFAESGDGLSVCLVNIANDNPFSIKAYCVQLKTYTNHNYGHQFAFTATHNVIYQREYNDANWTPWTVLSDFSTRQESSYANAFTNAQLGLSTTTISSSGSDNPFGNTSYCLQMKYSDIYGWQFALNAVYQKLYHRIFKAGAWQNWRLISPDVEDVSVSFASGSDSRLITNSSSITCKKSGAVVSIFFDLQANCSSTPLAPGDSFIVKLSGLPKPSVNYAYSVGYNGPKIYATLLDGPNNRVQFRNNNSSNAAGSAEPFCTAFTYLTDNT